MAIVLSLFPGAGLLDRGFEAAGFCVVRGPDVVFGQRVEVIPLPHPSGASTWHITEPGKSLLTAALKIMSSHPTLISLFLAHQISE